MVAVSATAIGAGTKSQTIKKADPEVTENAHGVSLPHPR
jgi:hypothetical protein